jgi:hypothetical protein
MPWQLGDFILHISGKENKWQERIRLFLNVYKNLIIN